MTKNNLKVVKTTKAQQAEGNEKNKALDAAIAQITVKFFRFPEKVLRIHSMLLFQPQLTVAET